MLTVIGASQDAWNLGSSDDWLSTGPVYYNGPFYYPNSDLPIGTQQFLNTYPSYMPFGYPNYYQTYNPTALNGAGTYTLPSNYLQGYNNPHSYCVGRREKDAFAFVHPGRSRTKNILHLPPLVRQPGVRREVQRLYAQPGGLLGRFACGSRAQWDVAHRLQGSDFEDFPPAEPLQTTLAVPGQRQPRR